MLKPAIAMLFILAGSTVSANPCESRDYLHNRARHLQPGSVSNDQLAEHLNASRYTHGLQFDIKSSEGNLYVDLTKISRTTQMSAGILALLQIGRLAEQDFEKLILVDGGEELFYFEGETVRENGCKTIWGVTTNYSPAPTLVGVMTGARHLDGTPLTDRYSGRILADLNLAVGTFNRVIAPEWLLSAVK